MSVKIKDVAKGRRREHGNRIQSTESIGQCV